MMPMTDRQPTTYFIETFGCQMNKNDSDLIDLSMRAHGFAPSPDARSADVVVFNTCSVRKHAEDRAIARMRSVRRPGARQEKTVVLAGCMAQRIGPSLIDDGTADLAVGPYESPRMGEIVAGYLSEKVPVIRLSQARADLAGRIDGRLVRRKEGSAFHEWVTISHGCDNFCSYCIVPHVRGPLVSFASEGIISHVRDLAANGITEVTLLGQNVNQYGMDSGDIPFYRLLARVADIDGLARVNFLTSHPKDFSRDIISVIRDHANISRSIHLPLQSGSDRILELMNRRYTMAHYMAIVEALRRDLPDHSLSTDLIAGFPGETEEEFRATLRAVEEIRFDEAFTYAYSPREGTAACAMSEALTTEEKLARLDRLITLQRRISKEKLASRVGRGEELIVEALSRKSDREVMGRTFLNHPVVLPGSAEDIGKKLTVRITTLKGATLYGDRIA